jgi:hypothetical protein
MTRRIEGLEIKEGNNTSRKDDIVFSRMGCMVGSYPVDPLYLQLLYLPAKWGYKAKLSSVYMRPTAHSSVIKKFWLE